MIEAVDCLNGFLESTKYCAGNEVTIADYAILATISTYVDGGGGLKLESYPNIQRWYKGAQENVPGYERTVSGLADLKVWLAKLN